METRNRIGTDIACAGIWIVFTCGPGLITIIHFTKLDRHLVWPLLSLAFVAVVEAGLTSSIVLETKSSAQAILGGGGLGLIFPVVGAYLLQKFVVDFENWSLVPDALVICFPSAIGGALAGWIQWRFNRSWLRPKL